MEREIINFQKPELLLSVHNLKMTKEGEYRGPHFHLAIEIIEVKSGVLTCHINDEVVLAHPNQIVIINSNIEHWLLSDNAEITYMQIDISSYRGNSYQQKNKMLFEFMSNAKGKAYLIFSDKKEITDILQRIHWQNQKNTRYADLYIKAYIYELVAFLYSSAFFATSNLVSKAAIEKIEPIVNYLESNYKASISLDDICRVAQYSKYTVCHIFKEITGLTVFDYINFLRVHYAVERLKEDNRSISEVAAESGFTSATYFNRVFKSIMGCSPSQYQKFLTLNLIG